MVKGREREKVKVIGGKVSITCSVVVKGLKLRTNFFIGMKSSK